MVGRKVIGSVAITVSAPRMLVAKALLEYSEWLADELAEMECGSQPFPYGSEVGTDYALDLGIAQGRLASMAFRLLEGDHMSGIAGDAEDLRLDHPGFAPAVILNMIEFMRSHPLPSRATVPEMSL